MSEFKGTPGPWHQNKWGAIVDSNGNSVSFRGVSILCSGDSKDIAEAEANTTLGTAATELLEACMMADQQMELAAECIEAARYDEAILHLRSLSRVRRNAIAKATGD